MTAGRSISIAAHTAEHFFKDQPTWLDRRNVYIYPVAATQYCINTVQKLILMSYKRSGWRTIIYASTYEKQNVAWIEGNSPECLHSLFKGVSIYSKVAI